MEDPNRVSKSGVRFSIENEPQNEPWDPGVDNNRQNAVSENSWGGWNESNNGSERGNGNPAVAVPESRGRPSMFSSAMGAFSAFKNQGSKNLKELHKKKYIRTVIWVVFSIFILQSVRKILQFFNINASSVYTYMFWCSILLFFFVILPVQSTVG